MSIFKEGEYYICQQEVIFSFQRFFLIVHSVILFFRAKWYDSKCDSKQALVAFVESVESYDPDVILGPPCSTGESGTKMLRFAF